ncbi:mitochondrial inner-membrane-bound regulator-domain-containing protein [Cladorrhinum samala]|uniref:Mitochondrial inner-membrane-bound regulator-domain-containing protein n=1 Tax=Cladorrhinum samala TaxID=585594 RepID=A0AAV9I1R5_9PEZI|nr:mitochondrial inner-membrane-bound regulator-domain-containing protein [Cladorrhinum samala]
MFGRKVTGHGSFICLRCRLQQRLQLTGAGAARRPPFSYPSYSTLSALSSRTNLPSRSSPFPAPKLFRRSFATEARSAPDAEPLTTENFFDTPEPQSEQQQKESIDAQDFENAFFNDPSTQTRQEGSMSADDFQGVLDGKAEPGEVSSQPSFTISRDRDIGPRLRKGPRWWKRRDMHVTAEGESISIPILGAPGSTLVVREVQKIAKKKLPELAPLDPIKLGMSMEDYLAQINDDKATIEEYLLNIHEMQPEDSRLISTREFLDLKDALVKGFTAPQLKSYMKHWETAQKMRGSNKLRIDRPWIAERRPWVPIIENAVETVEPELYGYILPDMTPKEQDAIRIMRTCWDLSVREVAAGQGYLDVRFRDVEFGLLTLGSQIWLQHIARRYLKPGKQIELYRQSGFCSIMAPMHTAYSILETINLFLENTVTVRFATKLISSSPLHLGTAILEKVGLMTSSVVRMEPSGREISVTWVELPDRKQRPEVEDPGEMVLRLLSYAYRSRPRASSDLVVVPADIEGRYIPEIDCEQKLPWQERSTKWARYTAALPLSSTPNSSSAVRGVTRSGRIPPGILRFPIDNTNSSGPSSGDWSASPRTETSAIFGRVLFPQFEANSPLKAPPSIFATPTNDLTHTFSSLLPSVRSLNFHTNLYEEGLWHTIVIMRLIPAPDLPKEIIAAAPELEVRLEADHQEVQRIVSVRAITDVYTGDVLFPASHVDVRLNQTRFYELDGRHVDKHAEPIIHFLEDSDLRPWEGKVATPPNLDGIKLPLKMFSSLPKSVSVEEGDLIKMDYMFGGLEIRRTVTAEHKGLKMRYTHIEGGRRRGRRSELSLDAVPVDVSKLKDGVPEKKAVAEQEKILEGLYVKDYKMAGEVLDLDEAVHAMDYDAANAVAKAKRLEEEETRKTGMNKGEQSRTVTEDEFFMVAAKIALAEGSINWFGKYSPTP